MTYERFLKITTTLKMQDELARDINLKGLDLVNFLDPYHKVITELIKEVYGEEGYEWWSWFCHESEYGTKVWKGPVYRKNEEDKFEFVTDETPRWGAHDEDENPICYSFLSTWEYLEKHHNKLMK
jgi:hypothetical protein